MGGVVGMLFREVRGRIDYGHWHIAGGLLGYYAHAMRAVLLKPHRVASSKTRSPGGVDF